MSITIPKPADFEEPLASLFDRKVDIRESKSKVDPKKESLVVTYETEEHKIKIVAVSTIAFAAYSAAALSMIPKTAAENSVRRGKIEENLLENFHEVMNILAGTLEGKGPRIRLSSVSDQFSSCSDDTKAILKSKIRLHAKIDIGGYGQGAISFYRAAE